MVEAVSAESGLPKAKVSRVLKSFLRSAQKVLETGESIKLPGFGTFFVSKTQSRPLFGGARMSEGRDTVRFRHSRSARGKARRSDR